MEISTVLIWILRIVLPMILFWIYFKFQSAKDETYSGSTKNQVSKAQMLAVRKTVAKLNSDEPCPPSMESMQLVDEKTAPSLFSQRAARPKKERSERTSRKEKRNKDEDDEPKDKSKKDKDPEVGTKEDKMHLESLLNYVAFNRKEQQRTFLPDEGVAPPPPPMKPPPKPKEDLLSNVSAADSAKANAEAQMVLRGSINFKRSDVAKDLYDQLTESGVEIAERTFALMIESCIHVSDLKNASDLLMKMEASGYCPDSDLLDKVMDLYSQQKLTRELEEKVKVAGPAADAGIPFPAGGVYNLSGVSAGPREVEDGESTKLSCDAPIFVPRYGASEVPPPPPPADSSEDAGARTGLNPSAVPFSMDAALEPPAPGQRTALSATALVFQPSGTVSFDPSTYTWTTELEDDKKKERKKKGKSDSPKDAKKTDDKGKGKSKEIKGSGKGKDQPPPPPGKDQPPPPPGKPPSDKKKKEDGSKPLAKPKAKDKPKPDTGSEKTSNSGGKWMVKDSAGTGGD